MVQADSEHLPSTSDEWICDAFSAIKIMFVRKWDDNCKDEGYPPEFVHQHFGENETIFGYKDLHVNIYYAEASMKMYMDMSFGKKLKALHAQPDDIAQLLRDQLPGDQQDMLTTDLDQFKAILNNEDSCSPYGELISKFSKDGDFEVYHVREGNPMFDKFFERVQSLSLFYIDAASYTDNEDPKWTHYLLYERLPPVGDGITRYAVAGYSSVYRFYAYPQHERPRIAQILIFPQYRRKGLGASLLQRVYGDLQTSSQVIDITVEDPADNFVFLRDYVDCVNCLCLPEFNGDSIHQPFSQEHFKAANAKFKICKRQCRRVYEILRLRATDKKDEAAMKKYRLEVKRRLEIPLRRNDKDWKKMQNALSEEEMAKVAVSESATDRIEQLSKLYELEVEPYKRTIERINLFPSIA